MVLDEGAQHEHFGPGVLHIQHHLWLHPNPSCPSAELGLPQLAQVLLLRGAHRGRARHVPSPCARGQGQKHQSLFQERTIPLPNSSCTDCGPSRTCSPGLLLFNASRYKRRDLEILVWLLSCRDGAHHRQTSCYSLARMTW